MKLDSTSARFTTAAVGEYFVDFYRARGYQEIEGGSLISDKLPMTFVMSAGMVQFEKLSLEQRSGDHYVLIQNCFRHFDLEQVGNSSFHLSLFQMPGAFDFGPIDRRAAVRRIWDLLTGRFEFDPEKLYVTYFLGGKIGKNSYPADHETAAAWQVIGLAPDHLIGMKDKSNFWKQSERMVGIANSRKCGPTTEVFYDRGKHLGCGPDCQPGCPCGRFVEMMNTIFISYFITEDEKFSLLPEPFVETVIGRERVAALLQGADSVYEIDNLLPLVQQVRCFAHSQVLASAEQLHHERLLVDHLRALLFLIKDGAPPADKGGRAYIMRILMRELLMSQRLLGIADPGFLRSMLFVMRDLYPDLTHFHTIFTRYLNDEEIKFRHTLQNQIRRFEEKLLLDSQKQIRGEEMLHQEKTHGIPHSLLAYLLWQKHIEFDPADYQNALSRFQQENRDHPN